MNVGEVTDFFMNIEMISDIPRWYAVHTKPREEERADANLKAWSVETFSPKVKGQRSSAFRKQRECRGKNLFPQYIFARFNLARMLHKVRFTKGVHKVVSFGGVPTLVGDEIIELIRSRVGEDGFVRIGEQFEPGDKVVVKDGPLKDLEGTFRRELDDHSRVEILLTAVSYHGRAIVERELVGKSPEAGVASSN